MCLIDFGDIVNIADEGVRGGQRIACISTEIFKDMMPLLRWARAVNEETGLAEVCSG